ncbi:nucleotide exchange factor GrpE [Longispora albida]|uniref:nucleotide exchange factor GrpE n=1 Tax=Longispora albida TaxID=203523 RepID=UPI0003602C0B|nr:nucleotide exchange factor GrpE [Longispora albida]
MSPSILRAAAAGLTAIVAVLTGVVAGLTTSHEECTTVMAPETRPGELPGAGPLKPVSRNCEPRSEFGIVPAAAGVFGVLITGGLVLGATAFIRTTPAPAAKPAPAQPVAAGPDPAVVAALESDRDTLIKTAVYVRDRASSKAIADRLGWALSEVGVATITPVGARFDPAQHEAGGSAPSPTPEQAGTIAAVEVAGYTDRGTVLRAPVVTVYRDGQ